MPDEARPLTAADVVMEHFATFGHGGLDEAARLWDPEIEWRPLEGTADVVRGQEAMRRYYAEWVDAIDDLRAEVPEVVFEDGGRVAVRVRNSGRGRVSGAPAAGNYYVACLVRNGLIVMGHEYATAAEAVAAAQAL